MIGAGVVVVIRSAREIGQLIRSCREAKGLTQAGLASLVGVSRKWVVDAEAGKPTVEMGLVLRTLSALGVVLTAGDEGPAPTVAGQFDEIPDVNDILAAYTKTS